jgi:hypothetical protein
MLQTIRQPKKGSMGSELKLKLPKSNYESEFTNSSIALTDRNSSVCKMREELSEKLPEILRRNSSRAVMEKAPQPRGRLLYLR